MTTILFLLFVSIAINLMMFLVAYKYKTDKFTDISYALSFIILAAFGVFFFGLTIWSILLLLMISAWAIRLGVFLFSRVTKAGKDSRFDEMRGNFWKFFSFWLLQGVTVWIVLLPSLLFFQDIHEPRNYILIFVGILIWLSGLLIEGFADYQKSVFRNNPANKDKWINTGLWKYSRHPNYFGEILVWLGVYIFSLSKLTTLQILFGAVSPLYISTLLIFVSGIPLLEKAADKKWGTNAEYLAYKKRTSVLVLLPNKS